MEYDQILELVKAVSKAGLSNFEYQEGDVRLSMSCPSAAENVVVRTVQKEAAPEAPVDVQTETEPEGNVVVSPLVGTFYAAPSEDEEPFVKVGDKVTKGQTLAIVEAMKLMNEYTAPEDGEILDVCFQNEELVEFGQVLFKMV